MSNLGVDAGTLETFDDAVRRVNSKVLDLPSDFIGKVSDGYHTFDELYEFRKAYNAALFNEWASEWHKACISKELLHISQFPTPKFDVHKSWRHNDGELCFGGGWFIVVAVLPTGQISNHYKAEDWELFKMPEWPVAKYEFDGHTGQDVLNRLKAI